jgi:hypothetical protein
MSVRDTPCLANRRCAAHDAIRRHLGNDQVAHVVALNKRERHRRDQIATRCAGWRTR